MFEAPNKRKKNQDDVTPEEFATDDKEVAQSQKEQLELKYSPFNPKKELKQIKNLDDHKQKEIAIERFKRLHSWQQFVLSNLYDDIASELSTKPDTPKEKVLDRMHQAAKDGRFTKKQITAAEKGIEAYYQRQKNIQEITGEYSDADSLFEYVTNNQPNGRVEVEIDGVTIYFRCFDDEDYARIYNTKFSGGELSQEEVSQADKTGGVSIHSGPEKLSGAITAEKAEEDDVSSYVFKHEREHAIQRLIKNYINFEFSEEFEAMNLSEASTLKEVRGKTKTYLHETWLPTIEGRMKDEIIAYMKGSKEEAAKTAFKLTQKPAEGGLYWPSKKDIKRIKKTLKFSFFNHDLDDQDINEVVNDELDKVVNDYLENIIIEGVAAFRNMRTYGYSDRQISAALISKPLDKWLNVARRMT